jgi:beta-phosphoglucomutase
MDGVITDTMSYHFEAWKQALKDNGMDVGYCDIYLREGQKGIETALQIMKENNIEASAKKAQDILEYKEKIFKKIARPKLIKNSRRLVKDLKKSGFKLALVTGTTRGELEYILPTGIFRLFDISVTGDEVKSGKPNAEPYLKAIKALKLKPNECIVLENAPFGIKSAKAANLYCIAVTTYLPKKHLKQADMILDSLEEVDKVIYRKIKHKRKYPSN